MLIHMSVKSSVVSCLSNAVSKMPLNYWERTLSIAMTKYFRNETSGKKMIISATGVVFIQLFSYIVVSKQKIKMITQNTMTPIYHPKVTSTQNKGVPFFSILRLSQSFSNISGLPILVDVQRLHANGKWILCVSNKVK